MLNIGQIVIYNTYGVCKVSEIIEKELSGITKEFYVLHPVNDEKISVFLPLDNKDLLSRARPVLTINEINEVISSFPFQPLYWIDNDNERKKEYNQIIKEGNRYKLISLIKSIYNHKLSLKDKKKKLHAIDEQFYKDAEYLLVDEISYVLNLNKLDALKIIQEKL